MTCPVDDLKMSSNQDNEQENVSYRNESMDLDTNNDSDDSDTEHEEYEKEVGNVLSIVDDISTSVREYEYDLETLIADYSRHTLCESLDITVDNDRMSDNYQDLLRTYNTLHVEYENLNKMYEEKEHEMIVLKKKEEYMEVELKRKDEEKNMLEKNAKDKEEELRERD